MTYIPLDVKDVVKASVNGSKVDLECKQGNRITLSRCLLKCLGGDLKSIHYIKQKQGA